MANDYLNLVIWPEDTEEEQHFRPVARIQWGSDSPIEYDVSKGIEMTIMAAKTQSKPASPDTSTLVGWRKVHDQHGKGPWHEVTVNGHEHWNCAGCGDRKIFTNGIAKETK